MRTDSEAALSASGYELRRLVGSVASCGDGGERLTAPWTLLVHGVLHSLALTRRGRAGDA